MNKDIISKAINMISVAGMTATIGLHDNNRNISVCAISCIKTEGLDVAWFSTNTTERKADLIRKDNRVGVCFFNEQNNISLTGEAEIITDDKLKKEMWLDWFDNHYKDGPTDKDYCLIKVTVEHVRLYVDDDIADFNIGSN
jgi:general stress protein 26